jgi:Na+-translocating ferredoxin:NAD+ oxidoreductase subunit B
MIGLLVLVGLALLFGAGLGFAARHLRVEGDPMVDRIDAILPQTQCGQCGFPGCRPYAQAISSGEADINQCPPGGQAGVVALAELLGREPKPLAQGDTGTDVPPEWIAVIDEDTCIGCTKCIQACPVDAIVGAARHRHTVIPEYCTGCRLCLEPICPVPGCIAMVAPAPTPERWQPPHPLAEVRP